MKKLRHGDRVEALDFCGFVAYVERGKARGFLAPCGAFYGLRELAGYLRHDGVDEGLRSLVLFEQAWASGLVDVEASSRRAERHAEEKLRALVRRVREEGGYRPGAEVEVRRARREFWGPAA